MHPSDGERPLWDVVGYLEWEAFEEWRKKHFPDLTREGAIADRLTSIETTVVRRPGGNISVTVSFLAKLAFACEVEYFSLQRAGNKLYRIVEKDSTDA